MPMERVRPALRERLGHEGTADLIDFLGYCRKEWQTDVISIPGERFERRLAEETSKLRLEMGDGFACLRQEMAQGFATVRTELAAQRADLFKWAFVFWIGQFFAIAGMVAVAIRVLRVP